MVKICHRCGYNNSDDSFWCEKCNTKLTKNILDNAIKEKKIVSDESNEDLEKWREYLSDIEPQEKTLGSDFPIFKTIAILVIIIVLFSSIVIIFSKIEIQNEIEIAELSDDFPSLNSDLPWEASNPTNSYKNYDNIGQMNKDYWFEGDKLYTKGGWIFTINKIKEYTLDAIVLDYRYYDISYSTNKPENIFSPIDLFLGVEDIKENPENYPFTTTYYSNRLIKYTYNIGASLGQYFKNHVGNNHIIPHNSEVINQLKEINCLDKVIINGYLVNLNGEKDKITYHWETDTKIGNYHCEIILINSLVIN